MNKVTEHQTSEKDIQQWFFSLQKESRYQFSTDWMAHEVGRTSNAKLAECLGDENGYGEQFIKSFRSWDKTKGRFKKVHRPDNGFTRDDVEQICAAINTYRAKNGRTDTVSAAGFFQTAWDELGQVYRPGEQVAKLPVLDMPTMPDRIEQPVSGKAQLDIRLLVLAAPVLLLCIAVGLWLNWGVKTPETAKRNAHYMPGNVVQWRQMNDNQQAQALPMPEFYLSAEQCYPDLAAQPELFNVTGFSQLKALPLGPMERYSDLLPDYQGKVELGVVTRWQLAKGQINQGISGACLAALQKVVDFGQDVEDYGVIKHAFVTDTLRFDVSGDGVDIVNHFAGLELDVVTRQSEVGDSRQITVSGPVVLGYIFQPISARLSYPDTEGL